MVNVVEQLLLLRRLTTIAFAGFGHGIEQAPCRVFLVQEHAAILNRDLDERNQHTADFLADIGIVLRPIQQYIKKQSDQVDGIAIKPIQRHVVASDPQLACALRHLLAQLASKRLRLAALRGRHGHRVSLALHQRQDGQQVMRGQRGGRACRIMLRCHVIDVAPALQLPQHAGKQGLIGGIDLHLRGVPSRLCRHASGDLVVLIGRLHCGLCCYLGSLFGVRFWPLGMVLPRGMLGFTTGTKLGQHAGTGHQPIATIVQLGQHFTQSALEELEDHDAQLGFDFELPHRFP